MRKNILTLCLVMSAFVASQSAFASRARNAVLGNADPLNVFSQGDHGSLYVDDAYNMFYSPAKIADHKNFVTMEKSNGEADARKPAASIATDAEGGFVTSMGDFQVGAFLNRTTAIRGNYAFSADNANPIGASTTMAGQMRPVELMFGGDAGVKYGLGLTYANFKNNTAGISAAAKNLKLRAGIEFQSLEVFADADLIGKNTFTAGNNNTFSPKEQEVKNKNYGVGVRYKYGEWVTYVGLRSLQVDVADTLIAAANTKSDKTMSYTMGLGRNAKLSESTSLNYSIGYSRSKEEMETKAGTKSFITREVVPVNLGLESDLATWFTARAGMLFNLVNTTNTSSTSVSGPISHQTTGALGGGLHFGKVDVDFAVSTAGNTATTADQNLNGSSFGFSSQLISYASMTYRW